MKGDTPLSELASDAEECPQTYKGTHLMSPSKLLKEVEQSCIRMYNLR